MERLELAFAIVRHGDAMRAVWRPGEWLPEQLIKKENLYGALEENNVLCGHVAPPCAGDLVRWDAPVEQWTIVYDFGFPIDADEERVTQLVRALAAEYQALKLREDTLTAGHFLFKETGGIKVEAGDDVLAAPLAEVSGGWTRIVHANRVTIHGDTPALVRHCEHLTAETFSVVVAEHCHAVDSRAAMLRATGCESVAQSGGVVMAWDCGDLLLENTILRAGHVHHVHARDVNGSVAYGRSIWISGYTSVLALNHVDQIVVEENSQAIIHIPPEDRHGLVVILKPGSRLILVSGALCDDPFPIVVKNEGGHIHTIGCVRIEEVENELG